MSGTKVHNCSKTIVTNAQNDPFKYLCKYFGIKPNEQFLPDFEGMLNDFSAAEEGACCLDEERGDLIASILRDLNPRIQQPKYRERLESELGLILSHLISSPIRPIHSNTSLPVAIAQ